MPCTDNGTVPFKKVNNCLNTNIHSYLEASGGKSSIPYLNVVISFNTSINQTSVAEYDSCFSAQVSYLETSGGKSSIPYLNVVKFFNTNVNQTSVAAYDSCFSAQVSIMWCSIIHGS